MTKKKTKVEEVEEIEEEETPKAGKKAKTYDVLDKDGNLLNIYESEATAKRVAGKDESRTYSASPAGRTREDVQESINALKKERLIILEGPKDGQPEEK